MSSLFEPLKFRHPFRKYQSMILDRVRSKWDRQRKFHIVAPPGAGKTLVGIELICRFGHPAVVFTPTATIQSQWQEKVGLFLQTPAERRSWVSTDPHDLKPFNVYTYQLLTTPGEELEALRTLAEADWMEALVREGKAEGEAAARVRIHTLRENNPDAYQAEIRKRYARRKREALRDPAYDSLQFLHPNARALIDRLAAYGVRTLVLDECHHLLDYWALITRELIRRIGDPYIVGLTATLPDPESGDAYENYVGLLGEVDFEVPTPAVVKEGNLAPYRDLVLFCEPTGRETDYLNDLQAAFERALHAITDSDRFMLWVAATLLYQPRGVWLNFLNEKPLLAIAGIKYLRSRGQSIPKDLPLLAEMTGPLTFDDWVVLLETFGLEVLKTSADRADHRLLADLEKALAPFGISLTERGLRQGRAPGDLVLALSEAKDEATIRILQAEQRALGAQLRAVVITDYEKVSARARRLKDVLDPDAGSAVRLFRALVADPALNSLDAILVTGSTVLLDSDHGEALLTAMRQWLAERRLSVTVEFGDTGDDAIMALSGTGQDWTSRTYVQLLTAMFEQGFTRCLVGTRGIFGEGWDALGLNTLIDLTAVTTSIGVNQLRGRTIRLDPSWDRKVAHNWDVVCVARNFERGDSDLKRFLRKHEHYWGIAPVDGRPETVAGGSGQIVKGVLHVDPDLGLDLTMRDLREINFERHNRQMLSRATADSRVASYAMWGIGQPYDNTTQHVTRLRSAELSVNTAHAVVRALDRLLWEFLGTWAAMLLIGLACLASVLLVPVWGWVGPACAAAFGLLALPFLLISLRGVSRRYRELVVDAPPSGALLDIGRAVLAGLQEAGLVARALDAGQVQVRQIGDETYEVFVAQASAEESDRVGQALRQVLGPIHEPRYLVTRDVSTLPNPVWQVAWLILRRGLRPDAADVVYHPVPDALAANKQRAEAFAAQWRRYVGGGELVFAKSEAGRRALLQARAQRRPRVKLMAFEVWR